MLKLVNWSCNQLTESCRRVVVDQCDAFFNDIRSQKHHLMIHNNIYLLLNRLHTVEKMESLKLRKPTIGLQFKKPCGHMAAIFSDL